MFTFGSDPEFMLQEAQSDKIYSAIEIVGGDIYNRIKLGGHEFYYDNVLCECAIRYGDNRSVVIDSFRECFQIYAELVNPYKLLVRAAHEYSDDQLDHPMAKKVGCKRDWCAYEVKMMDPPREEIQNGNLRTCGGHIHLGGDDQSFLREGGPESLMLLHTLDLFLATTSLYLDRDPSQSVRRNIYGQAGRYRVKPYGVEYRSLSNFWLKEPCLVELVWDICDFAIKFIEDGSINEFWEFDEEAFFDNRLSESLVCKEYNSKELKIGIDTSSKDICDPFFQLALRLMPEWLSDKIMDLIGRKEQDFYEAWSIAA